MGIVTVGAFPSGARVLNLRRFDQLRLVVMTGQAKRFAAGLNQHDLAVLRRRVATVARLGLKRTMLERPHEFGGA